MRSNTRNYILTAASAVAALFFCQPLHAIATISVNFNTINGAYDSATTSPGSPSWTTQLVFCLDGDQYYNGGTTGNPAPDQGTLSNTVTAPMTAAQEEEAAFLTAYAVVLDPNRSHLTIEGNIQAAIWSVMGTGPTPATGSVAAGYLVTMTADIAANPTVFTIGSAFMSSVLVWTPSTYNYIKYTGGPTVNGNQRFISAGTLPPGTLTSTPEPGTMVFLGTGVLLLALSRVRRRRC